MAENQARKSLSLRIKWGRHLLVAIGLIISGLLVAAVILFWDEIPRAAHYGYIGGFFVGILAGVTIIPAPSLLVVFTLGHMLNPVYVGLVSGLGEALGGMTIYLTGAGGGAMWSKLRSRQQALNNQANSSGDILVPLEARVQSRWRAFYDRLAVAMQRKGGSWLLFLVSAIPLSPYYFAGLAAGTFGMSFRRFFLVSWAGKTIKGLIIAFAGYWGLYFLLRWIGV